jgi:galactose mutarotase-like enzyme
MRLLMPLLLLSLLGGGSSLAAQEYSVTQKDGFVVLENGTDIRVVIAPDEGGELTGFSVFFDGAWRELLYRALDYSGQPGWRGKAPLLWPATGISLSGDGQKERYDLDGVSYEMPFHGFAKSLPWQLWTKHWSAETASVTLHLGDSIETRRYYPFGFDLKVEYRLHSDRLSLLYDVTADAGNDRAMPFSIGNHITFKAPLIEGSEAAQTEFENDFPRHLITGTDKAFAGVIEPSAFRGRHSLSDLPMRKSVSLAGGKEVAELTIYDPSGLQLQLLHHSSSEAVQPSIKFNLWADTVTGFFSPEPWVGTQNSLNTGMGIVSLQPGQSWQWKIDIIPRGIGRPDVINSEEIQ